MQYCIYMTQCVIITKDLYIITCILCNIMAEYVGINIPVSLAKVLDDIVKKEGIYGTRAALVKHLIQDWVEDYRKEQRLLEKKQ